jgi:DNA processing protein
LQQTCGSDGERAWSTGIDELAANGYRTSTIKRFQSFRQNIRPAALAERLDRDGIAFLLFDDDGYPPLLRQIADPPMALFVRGNADLHELDAVSIVGTRSNTSYGRHVTRWLGNELARAGFAIVSGLAGGIDTHAHEAALDSGGICVAVLGSGVDDDSIYPRSNLRLAGRIVENGGSIVSEFPPGTLAKTYYFPLRNRIISGSSRATVVVEAAEKSGSLITAFQALEQNREVFSVPGPITNLQSAGTNRLLTMGAIPCTSPDDVIRLLHGSIPEPPRVTTKLTDEERALLNILDTPRHADEIARSLGASVSDVNARLMHLELAGWVTPQGAQIYARSGSGHASAD